MTRDELIAALEGAAGPDPLLDAEIYRIAIMSVRGDAMVVTSDGKNTVVHRPFYTASRDATLPGAESLDWKIHGATNMRPMWAVRASLRIEDPRFNNDGRHDTWWSGHAATEPLARRIAEIKALVKS